jgi:hypothetical protein
MNDSEPSHEEMKARCAGNTALSNFGLEPVIICQLNLKPRGAPLPFGLALLFVALPAGAQITRERLSASALIYFRDMAELPMDVDVHTVVQDPAGKTTKIVDAQVRLIFKGYRISKEGFSFSFHSNSGWFSAGSLNDSMAGDLGAQFAAGLLGNARPEDNFVADGGKVTITDKSCDSFSLDKSRPIPRFFCGSTEYRIGSEPDGNLGIEHFSMTLGRLPVRVKLNRLGPVELRSYKIGGDYQKRYLPGDPKPFLIPNVIVVEALADKGRLTVTNRYKPAAPKPEK